MTVQPRLIASLLVDDHLHLVKTTSFESRHYLGDPLNAAYVFSGFEVDELLVLDIDATPQGRSIPLKFIESLSRFTSVPLCIGGGISSIEQIQEYLALGVEKVALSSVLDSNFGFLAEAADRFGSSTISVIINSFDSQDQSRSEAGFTKACLGRPGQGKTSHPLFDLALACQNAGAGELIINHANRDGTFKGFSIPPLIELNRSLKIPLVAVGGCGSNTNISELLSATSISGIAAGSMFCYANKNREVLLNYPLTYKWLHEEYLR